jgi:hypothetical protein
MSRHAVAFRCRHPRKKAGDPVLEKLWCANRKTAAFPPQTIIGPADGEDQRGVTSLTINHKK